MVILSSIRVIVRGFLCIVRGFLRHLSKKFYVHVLAQCGLLLCKAARMSHSGQMENIIWSICVNYGDL